MSIFDGNMPYTNLHELNLDWVIKEVKKALETQDEIAKNLPQITEQLLLQLIGDGVIGFTLGTSYNPINEELTLSEQVI